MPRYCLAACLCVSVPTFAAYVLHTLLGLGQGGCMWTLWPRSLRHRNPVPCLVCIRRTSRSRHTDSLLRACAQSILATDFWFMSSAHLLFRQVWADIAGMCSQTSLPPACELRPEPQSQPKSEPPQRVSCCGVGRQVPFTIRLSTRLPVLRSSISYGTCSTAGFGHAKLGVKGSPRSVITVTSRLSIPIQGLAL